MSLYGHYDSINFVTTAAKLSLAFRGGPALYLRALRNERLMKAQVKPFKLPVLPDSGKVERCWRRRQGWESNPGATPGDQQSTQHRSRSLSPTSRTFAIGYSTQRVGTSSWPLGASSDPAAYAGCEIELGLHDKMMYSTPHWVMWPVAS